MKKNYPFDFSLVIPCYNEESLLKDSVEKIQKTFGISRLSYEFVFVDDKSSDKTLSIIRSLCRKNINFTYLAHEKNMGRGRTVVDGIVKAKGKVAGYIDIDLEVSSVYLPEMVKKILDGEADMIIGKRIYRTSSASIFREVFSRGYSYLLNSIINVGGYDTESGYKLFDRKKILPVLSNTKHPHWFWDTEIVVFAQIAKLKIMEVPVLFIRRFDKQSKVKIFKDVLNYLISLWGLRRRLKREKYI